MILLHSPFSNILSYSSWARRRLLPHWGQKRERFYSAFNTARAFLMPSKLTVPPHTRWTYSGVIPARSIEQERISFSNNYCRQLATHSQPVHQLLRSFQELIHKLNTSPFPSGSYAPSLHSRITVPDSSTSTECHCP